MTLRNSVQKLLTSSYIPSQNHKPPLPYLRDDVIYEWTLVVCPVFIYSMNILTPFIILRYFALHLVFLMALPRRTSYLTTFYGLHFSHHFWNCQSLHQKCYVYKILNFRNYKYYYQNYANSLTNNCKARLFCLSTNIDIIGPTITKWNWYVLS